MRRLMGITMLLLLGLVLCISFGQAVLPIRGTSEAKGPYNPKTVTAPDAIGFGARRIDTERFLPAGAMQQKLPSGYSLADTMPAEIQTLVVPHHGVAAEMAAEAISLWAQAKTKPTAVILLGPNHENAGPPAATTRIGWETAAGSVDSHPEILRSLIDQGLVKEDDGVFENEHSIGALMPWLAKYLPGTPVVPLIFHYRYPTEDLAALFSVLQPWLDGGAVILVSIDFSHGLSMEGAEAKDRQTREYLLANDWKTIAGLDSTHLDAPTLLAAVMAYSAAQGQGGPCILSNTNAGRLMKNSRSEVTSYFTLAFGPEK